MIKADIHVHTSFSSDCNEPMENQIKSAISKGLTILCITEHMDFDFPKSSIEDGCDFILDTPKYYDSYKTLKDKYQGKITLLFGVELGLQPHLYNTLSEYINTYPFDYIIGSEHITNKKDPYYASFYEGRSEYDAYCEYFEDICTNIDTFSDFNTLGHLDYVVRYGPNKNKDYSYSKYSDYIDEILKRLITKGIALEINTGGYKSGLNSPNPCKDIVLRYKELGGELITIGSDSHDSGRIAADFDKVEALLTDCGIKYYSYFVNRKPLMIHL